VARAVSCVSLLGHYAAMERARQFLLNAGAEALLPAPILVSAAAEPGLRYDRATDTFTLGEGPNGARVPLALNPGAVTREMSRRQLRAVAALHPEEAEGIAFFLGAAAAAGDPGYLAISDPGGDPTGQLDVSRPLPAGAPASAVLAGALWGWADASGDLTGAARAALAAARALGSAPADPAAVLSLVAAQLEGAARDRGGGEGADAVGAVSLRAGGRTDRGRPRSRGGRRPVQGPELFVRCGEGTSQGRGRDHLRRAEGSDAHHLSERPARSGRSRSGSSLLCRPFPGAENGRPRLRH